MKNLKAAFADDPEIIAALNQKELLAKSGTMIETPYLEGLKTLFKGDKGDKGDPGLTQEEIDVIKAEILTEATPEKFKDYFTTEELQAIVDHVVAKAAPVKGVDYFDGEDGRPGRDAKSIDPEELAKKAAKYVNIKSPEVPKEELFKELDAKIPKFEDFLKYLKGLKGDDRLDVLALKNVEQLRGNGRKFDMNDQRWHGAGDTVTAGTNVTITTDSEGRKVISATGTGGTSRIITSISTPTTAGSAASTDYVYFVSGTTTLTMPTAVGNTNRYTVKNTGSAVVTIDTTGGQTIDGSATYTINVPYAVDLISDNTQWFVV